MAASKRRKKTDQTHNAYIAKMLHKKHPDIGISRNALRMANGILDELSSRLVVGTGRVARLAKKATMSQIHVRAATNVMLPLDLASTATSEATQAVAKFTSAS